MTQPVTCRCGAVFQTQVRNGLKQHRKCEKCRPSLKPQSRLRRTVAPSRNRKLCAFSRSKRPFTDRLKVDWEATELAKFSDKRSYIDIRGRWRAYGDDATKIRNIVFDRDKGICCFCQGWVSWELGECHHTTPRSQGRDDRPQNQAWAHGRFTKENCHHRIGHKRLLHFSTTSRKEAHGV